MPVQNFVHEISTTQVLYFSEVVAKINSRRILTRKRKLGKVFAIVLFIFLRRWNDNFHSLMGGSAAFCSHTAKFFEKRVICEKVAGQIRLSPKPTADFTDSSADMCGGPQCQKH